MSDGTAPARRASVFDMKPRIGVLFVLAVVALGLGVVAGGPAMPAWACSCVAEPSDDGADLIVIGTVAHVSDDAVLLNVDSVEKGGAAPGDDVSLRVSRDEASCGFGFEVGRRYRVPSRLGATNRCDGIRGVPAATPSPGSTTTGAAGSAPPRLRGLPATAPAANAGPWPGGPVAGVVTGVVLAGLVGCAAAVVLRRRRPGG